jgi:hypothetical protein
VLAQAQFENLAFESDLGVIPALVDDPDLAVIGRERQANFPIDFEKR